MPLIPVHCAGARKARVSRSGGLIFVVRMGHLIEVHAEGVVIVERWRAPEQLELDVATAALAFREALAMQQSDFVAVPMSGMDHAIDAALSDQLGRTEVSHRK